MNKYRLLLTYVGTRYCGWQKQKGSAAEGEPSIQGTIESMVERMTGEKVSVVGSGRTDSGVHALGQVAHFKLDNSRWKTDILQKGLNSLLPHDIRVLALSEAPAEFHAQRSALKKQYSYYFQQGPCAVPHLYPFSWWIKKRLDIDAIQAALDQIRGQHDFKPFQSAGAKPGPTVRAILEAEASWEQISFPGTPFDSGSRAVGLVRVRLIGTGFLKQMVRGIAGTLLQIGEGRRPASDMGKIIASGDRNRVGPTAPPRALWLERVWYDSLEWPQAPL